MVVDVHYPVDEAEWYAKGSFDTGEYFEVPAVFYPDGSCDIGATDAKIEQLYLIVKVNP